MYGVDCALRANGNKLGCEFNNVLCKSLADSYLSLLSQPTNENIETLHHIVSHWLSQISTLIGLFKLFHSESLQREIFIAKVHSPNNNCHNSVY